MKPTPDQEPASSGAVADPEPTAITLREVLQALNNNFKELGPSGGSLKQLGGRIGCPFYEFILRNGKEFRGQPLPKRYKKRLPKRCFYNTHLLVRDSNNLNYTEGYVWSKDLPIFIHHAWAINRRGEVIDVTLGDSHCAGAQYLGVSFPHYLLTRANVYCGLLSDDWGCAQLDNWLAVDPSFKELL